MTAYEDRLSNDKDFLMWVRNRLVNLFGDDPKSEYIERLETLSAFLPGPVVIVPMDRDIDPEYIRIPKYRLDDLGDYFMFKKGDEEPMRQYKPYEEDPELRAQRDAKRAEMNRKRNESGVDF